MTLSISESASVLSSTPPKGSDDATLIGYPVAVSSRWDPSQTAVPGTCSLTSSQGGSAKSVLSPESPERPEAEMTSCGRAGTLTDHPLSSIRGRESGGGTGGWRLEQSGLKFL